MSYLLDTNVVSEPRKRKPDPNVEAWLASVQTEELHISVLVIGELRRGVERLRRRDPQQASAHEAWIGTVKRDFSMQILPVTENIADLWGQINVPNPVSAIDGLMAATATVHDLTLVTRNVRDFEHTEVRLLNPFEAHGP